MVLKQHKKCEIMAIIIDIAMTLVLLLHFVTINKPRVCAWCGENCYTICSTCKNKSGKGIPLHYNPKKKDLKDVGTYNVVANFSDEAKSF